MDRLQLINSLIQKAQPGEEPGEFRGGDPEEIRLKREEKREDADLDKAVRKQQRAPKNEAEQKRALVRKQHRIERGTSRPGEAATKRAKKTTAEKHTVKPLKIHVFKAQPGEEAGTFRGGDPEEIRLKREEKKEELEASGAADEMREEAENSEAPDPADIEEAQQADEDKKLDHGKSLVTMAMAIKAMPFFPSDVSPVDTFGDYNPRDANGDSLDAKYSEYRKKQPLHIEVCPPRRGENQHKVWSEVLGIRVPLTGSRIQHLRRYYARGMYEEAQKEADKLIRSMIDEMFDEPISKAAKGEMVPGHKYARRWWGDFQWNYEYSNGPHPSKHGAQHSFDKNSINEQGHTLDVHPAYKGNDPKEAYEFSRHMAVAQGGKFPVKIHDEETGDEISANVVMLGAKKDKEGKPILDEEGKPVLPSKPIQLERPGQPNRRFDSVDQYQKWLLRNQVTTVNDINGDPWLHWRRAGTGGRPGLKYDKASEFSEGKHTDKFKGTSQRIPNEKALLSWVEDRKAEQQAQKESKLRVSVPPEERQAYDIPMIVGKNGEEKPITTQLARGELGSWVYKNVPVEDTVQHPSGTSFTRSYVRKARVFEFDNLNHRDEIITKLTHENGEELVTAAAGALRETKIYENQENYEDIIGEVIVRGMNRSVEAVVGNFDPSKGPFMNYFTRSVKKYMIEEAIEEAKKFRENKEFLGSEQDVASTASTKEAFGQGNENFYTTQNSPDYWNDESNKSISNAIEILKKAIDEQGGGKYLWEEGEPGAKKYMWESPEGNIVRMTNAPEGHEHFDPEQGPPQLHLSEPTKETAPQFFDSMGQKLNRAKPEGLDVEDNPDYNPTVPSWVHKYNHPQTGEDEYIYHHRDRVLDERNKFNEDIRLLDAKLEDIRQWYKQLFHSDSQYNRALALAVALIDQAKVVEDTDESGLLGLKVKNITLNNNLVKLSFKDASGNSHEVQALLGPNAHKELTDLMSGKERNDYVFEVEGSRLQQSVLARILDEKFGVTPQSFRIFHGTELFSKEFQTLAATKPNLSPKHLDSLRDQALSSVAKLLGHKSGDLASIAQKLYVDPLVIESSYMGAIHHHDPDVNKSFYKLQGKTEFQGLPVSIENKKGSIRKWFDPHVNQSGQTKMQHDYGYIRRTKGTDGDHVDAYIGPNSEADTVYIVHQMKSPDFAKYDEDKVMLGFGSSKEAKEAYLKHYDDSKFFGSMTEIPMEKFKEKVFATKDKPKMIKALPNRSDSIVWHVSIDHPNRTRSEQMFSMWIHSHPAHEHDQHWHAFKHATDVSDAPVPPSGRKYASQEAQGEEQKAESTNDHKESSSPDELTQSSPESSQNLDIVKAMILDSLMNDQDRVVV